MMDIKEALFQWCKRFLIKKTSATRVHWEALDTQNKFTGSGIENENILNIKLAEELHEPIIRNFKKRKVLSSFRQYLGYWSFCYTIKK